LLSSSLFLFLLIPLHFFLPSRRDPTAARRQQWRAEVGGRRWDGRPRRPSVKAAVAGGWRRDRRLRRPSVKVVAASAPAPIPDQAGGEAVTWRCLPVVVEIGACEVAAGGSNGTAGGGGWHGRGGDRPTRNFLFLSSLVLRLFSPPPFPTC
ncbi:Os02g0269650, partial [Oryza sativa Japonica Group]